MQTSKRKINSAIRNQISQLLYQFLAETNSQKEIETFLNEALTKTELEMLIKRLGAAYYLNQKKSYSEIRKKIRISSATISEIANKIKKSKGFRNALKKIEAEEWANKWSKKISKKFKFPL